MVATRFAPSPTGFLHIGGARTALFNWLYAKAKGGRFYLRIEDTDQARSKLEFSDSILSSLKWLGLDWDGELISQKSRQKMHVEASQKLLNSGAAYKCYLSPKEIDKIRLQSKEKKQRSQFSSPWRDADPSTYPDKPYCIRLKAPLTGETEIDDKVFGRVRWENRLLDDMIIIRTDGSPTYNFAVVVDDHSMGITHVIRGDDHLSNTAKQVHVYRAFGWTEPTFAHVPLILDENGKKLSKRTASVGLDTYIETGIPPEAMRNYLARLGWSHGDQEFFSTVDAISWFDLNGLRKSAARLDSKKLSNLSKKHIGITSDIELLDQVNNFRSSCGMSILEGANRSKALASMSFLKTRAKNLADISAQLAFIESVSPLKFEDPSLKFLNENGISILIELKSLIESADWDHKSLDKVIREWCQKRSLGFGQVAQPLRTALTGSVSSPSVLDIMLVLERHETIKRIENAIKFARGVKEN